MPRFSVYYSPDTGRGLLAIIQSDGSLLCYNNSRGRRASLPFSIFQYIKQMSYDENRTTNTSCTIIVFCSRPADVLLQRQLLGEVLAIRWVNGGALQRPSSSASHFFFFLRLAIRERQKKKRSAGHSPHCATQFEIDERLKTYRPISEGEQKKTRQNGVERVKRVVVVVCDSPSLH